MAFQVELGKAAQLLHIMWPPRLGLMVMLLELQPLLPATPPRLLSCSHDC